LDKRIAKYLLDRDWRLTHLYRFVNDEGEECQFNFRPAQHWFYHRMWYWNLILKARQLGFTTFIDLFILDHCVFNTNQHAAIICHNLKSAQRIFHNKILYPYEHLPWEVREAASPLKCDSMELRLSNGSQIWVGTGASTVSATCRLLHISELGKICATYPEKARDIKTGALPTLHDGSYLFVESTAEGPAGLFYEMAQSSRGATARALREGRDLQKKEIKFHFFPWWRHPQYTLANTEGILMSDELERYFDQIAEPIQKYCQERQQSYAPLTDGQKAWYTLTRDGPAGQGEDMKQQYPSTPDEPFELSSEGAVYGRQMNQARSEGRIGHYDWVENTPVYTFWDIGYHDAQVAIFAQFLGGEIRIIDHHSEVGRGAPYHAHIVNNKPYTYGGHYFPHDVMEHQKNTGVVLIDDYKKLLRVGPVLKVPKIRRESEGIAAVRTIFRHLHIHAPTCDREKKAGYSQRKLPNFCQSLAMYSFEYDEAMGDYKKVPRLDRYSHDCKALETLAVQHRLGRIGGRRLGETKPVWQGACNSKTILGVTDLLEV